MNRRLAWERIIASCDAAPTTLRLVVHRARFQSIRVQVDWAVKRAVTCRGPFRRKVARRLGPAEPRPRIQNGRGTRGPCSTTQETDLLPRINPACSAPLRELDRVDAAVTDLGTVDHGVVDAEQDGQITLSEFGVRSHLAQHGAHAAIGGFVLCSCCQGSSRLNYPGLAASLAAEHRVWPRRRGEEGSVCCRSDRRVRRCLAKECGLASGN